MFIFDKFYKGLFKRTDYFDNYLEKFPEGKKKTFKKEIMELLQKNYQEKDKEGLRHSITVAYLDGTDSDYTLLLINLLGENWHTSEEDLVDLLELARDPRSIDCLFDLAIEIPEYDDGRSLAKKCIWALGSIKTKESKNKLKILSKHEDPIIHEAAILQINHDYPDEIHN